MKKLSSISCVAVLAACITWVLPVAAQADPVDSATLSCFVETPKFDQYTQNFCSGVTFGGPNTTIARFKVFGVGSGQGFSYQWSESACGNTPDCTVTIWAYQPKQVSVTVTNNSTSEQKYLSATAYYELGY